MQHCFTTDSAALHHACHLSLCCLFFARASIADHAALAAGGAGLNKAGSGTPGGGGGGGGSGYTPGAGGDLVPGEY